MFPSIHGVVSQGGASRPPEPTTSTLIQAQPSPITTGFTTDRQVGWEFTVGGSDLTATGARLFLSSTSFSALQETVRLWRVSDQTLLASVAITPAAGDQWYSAEFSSPVTLTAGAAYRLTTRRTTPASRGIRSVSVADLALHPGVTFNISLFHNGDAWPSTTDSAVNLYGLVDLVVEG